MWIGGSLVCRSERQQDVMGGRLAWTNESIHIPVMVWKSPPTGFIFGVILAHRLSL